MTPSGRLSRLSMQLQPKVLAETDHPVTVGKIVKLYLRPPVDPSQPHKYFGGDNVTFQREPVPHAKFDQIGLVGDVNATASAVHAHVDNGGVLRRPPDGAVLAQSEDHYESLRRQFPEKATAMKVGQGPLAEKPRMSGEGAGSGEQLYVSGLNNTNVCVGDTFAVKSGGQKKGLLQVSNPRRPCSNWDRKYEALGKGLNGVRHHTLTNTLGGWMFRVLEPGELKEGDTLELVDRLHPKWTLKTIGSKLYGSAGALPATWTNWSGTLEELTELSNIEELGLDEWREDVEELRAKAMGEKPRNFAMKRSMREFGSNTAQKEMALFFNNDEPEPGYFARSETWQKYQEIRARTGKESIFDSFGGGKVPEPAKK